MPGSKISNGPGNGGFAAASSALEIQEGTKADSTEAGESEAGTGESTRSCSLSGGRFRLMSKVCSPRRTEPGQG